MISIGGIILFGMFLKWLHKQVFSKNQYDDQRWNTHL